MARVLLLLGCLGLWGCANPISNEVFYQDAAFLSAMPGQQRFRVSDAFLNPPTGDSVILAQGAIVANELDALLSPMITSAELLRPMVPDERSPTVISWQPRSVAAETSGGVSVWWVRGQIARPSETSDLEWQLEVAEDVDGDWVMLASGRHDPEGFGSVELSLDLAGPIVGSALQGSYTLDYDDTGGDGRQVEIERVSRVMVWARVMVSDVGLAWTDSFTITDDGRSWPGVVQVVHSPDDGGGRALGEVYRDDSTLAFESCWGPSGGTQWFGGDDEIVSFGSARDCTMPRP